MKTTLTKADHVAITRDVMKKAFSERFMMLAIDRQALAYDVYDRFISDERAQALSAPWVTRDLTKFYIHNQEGGHVFGFSVVGEMLKLSRDFSISVNTSGTRFYADTPDQPRKIVLPNAGKPTFAIESLPQEVIDRYDAFEARQEEICSEFLKRKPEVHAVVSSTRSTSKLIEMWPEVEPFIPKDIHAPARDVPATADLNKALGLGK